jgi:methionyl-tRNA synthetase
VHMIGKDILRFHAVYWPAFLMAAYPDQPEMLPTTVFAHGWIYYEQDKMSKSKGNVAYPEPIIDALDSFGAPGNDALRYYLLREAPFGHDLSFSYEGLIQRFNSDLANDLGNLANRTITMINRYFGGEVPEPTRELTAREDKLKAELFGGSYEEGGARFTEPAGLIREYELFFDRFQLQTAVDAVWTLVSMLNGYLVEHQPWKLAESKSEDNDSLLALVLYTAADLLRTVTILLYPILPDSSERLWQQLGCEGQVNDQPLDKLRWGALKPGTKVGKPEPIFPRLDKPATLAKLQELAESDRAVEKVARAIRQSPKEESTKVQPQPEDQTAAETVRTPNPESRTPSEGPRVASPGPAAPSPDQKISIEDFAKVDMRVGEILSAEPLPGAKKLLKMMVDIGTEVRQVCAGIAEHYRPEELVGMKVVLVANLQPRKLRGIESNGMIVAASIGEEGKPILATFKEDVPKGARLK